MDKESAQAWRDWWAVIHGKNTPAGSYNPLEAHMHQAFMAGWDAAQKGTRFTGLSGYEVREIEEKARTKREAIGMTEEMLDAKNP
jgi:hypothetical protein